MGLIDKFRLKDDDYDDDFYDDDFDEDDERKPRPKNQILVIIPKRFEDGKAIVDHLLKGSAVVINLITIDVNVGQRIVDFVAGACYAINGNLQRINEKMVIISPRKIQLSGDFMESIKER